LLGDGAYRRSGDAVLSEEALGGIENAAVGGCDVRRIGKRYVDLCHLRQSIVRKRSAHHGFVTASIALQRIFGA
jgi:hypothetical protein